MWKDQRQQFVSILQYLRRRLEQFPPPFNFQRNHQVIVIIHFFSPRHGIQQASVLLSVQDFQLNAIYTLLVLVAILNIHVIPN